MCTCTHLQDSVDAKVKSLEVVHPQECAGHNFADVVSAQVDVLEGRQGEQVHFFDGLERREKRWIEMPEIPKWLGGSASSFLP